MRTAVRAWLHGRARAARLRAALAQRKQWIERRSKPHPSASAQHALDAASHILESAQSHRADLNTAWTLVLEADCVLLEALAADELHARVTTLRAEICEKLTGWRQTGALKVLGKSSANPSLADVQEALRTLNEDFNNRYFKFDLLATQILQTGVVLLLGLIAALIASAKHLDPLTESAPLLAWSMLLGAIGGALSAARGLTDTSRRRKIPEQLTDTPVTLTRPIVGAAAGLLAAILVKAGVASIAATDKDIAPLCAAFVAGFSERFFLALIPTGEKQ